MNDSKPQINLCSSNIRKPPRQNCLGESFMVLQRQMNVWIKEELFLDMHATSNENICQEIDEYICFFNERRPSYALNYLIPHSLSIS